MKTLIHIISAVSLVGALLAGCTSTENQEEISGVLTGEEITIDDDFDGGIIRKVISDTIYAETYGPRYFHQMAVVSFDTLTSIGRFSRKGQGPGEFIQQVSLGVRNNIPYVIGKRNGTVQAAKINTVDPDGNPTMYPPMSMQDVSAYSYAFIVDDDSTFLFLVAPWEDPENLFGRYNYNTGAFTPLVYWPDDGFTGPSHSKYRFYADNSKLKTNHAGKYFYSLANGRKAFIFSIRNDSVIIEHTIYDYPVSYSADDDGLNYSYDYSGHEFSVDSNDSIIVFLHRALTAEGREPGPSEFGQYGNRISVWDWDGKLIGSYELDHLVYGIYVNSSDNSFYARMSDKQTGDDLMWRYRIDNR